MHNLYELACGGKGQIMLVSGEVGCGKSALVNHFAQKASAIKTSVTISFKCRCASAAVSYGLFYRLCMGKKTSLDIREFFRKSSPEAVADYFFKILLQISETTPLIITADDLQYCNPDIYSMIYTLARHIVDEPCKIMAVAAYNMSDSKVTADPLTNRIRRDLFPITIGNITSAWESGGLCELVPEPLKLSDTADLLTARFPKNTFPTDTANIIHSVSNGKPAFIVNLLDYMQNNGDIKLENSKWSISNLNFYSSARQLENVISKPSNNSRYRYSKPKTIILGNPKDLLDKAIEAAYKPSMLNAIELADSCIASLVRFRDNDASFQYRAVALQVKHKALSWLGYYREALECADQLLIEATRHNDRYYTSAGYYCKGYEYLNMADFNQAEVNLQTSVNLIKHMASHPALNDCYHALGKMNLMRNNYTAAAHYLDLALQRYIKAGNEEKAAAVKIDYATLKRATNDNPSSYTLLSESIAYYTKAAMPHMLAKAYINVGLSFDTDSRYADAKRYFTEALRLCFTTGDRINIANCYNNMGIADNAQSNYADALAYFHKALEIDRMLGNSAKISISYNNIGIALLSSGDEDGAEKYFNAALENDTNSDHHYGIALTYSNLGSVYAQKSQNDIAIRYYELALKTDQDNHDIAGMIADYNAIGNLYYGAENIDEAMQCFNKSLELSEQSNDEVSRAAVYNNIGNIYFAKQDFKNAAHYYTEALAINTPHNDKAAAALNYSNLASIYEEQENIARAETYYEKAIELYHKTKLKTQEAYNLNALAKLYYNNEKFDKAKTAFLHAARIYKKTGDTKEYVKNLTFAGDTMRMLNEYKEAQRVLDESVELCKSIGDIHAEAFATGTLACMYNEQYETIKAIEYYKRAIDLYYQNNELDRYADTLSTLAYIYSDAGDLSEALICQHQVVETYRQIGDSEQIASAYALIGMFYDEYDYEKEAENYVLAAQYFNAASKPVRRAESLFHAAAALMHTKERETGYSYLNNAEIILEDLLQNDTEPKDNTITDTLIQTYTATADYFFENKEYTKAIEKYSKALKLSSETEAHSRTAYLCNNIGYTYDTIGFYPRALEFYIKACEEYDKEEFKSEGLFNNLKNVALMYDRLGNRSKAAEYYRRAFESFEKEFHIDAAALAECALSTATTIFETKGDIESASTYFNKAFHLFKNNDNYTGMIKALLGRAESYTILRRNDDASLLANQIMHIFDIAPDIDTKCNALRASAQIYIKIGNFDEAVKKFQQALDILFARDLWDAAAHLYYSMATIFAENCGKMAATIDFNGKTLTMYDFITKLLSNAADLAKTEKDTDLEIQAIVSQARYNVSCDEKVIALAYIDRAVNTATATGQPLAEASVLLEKADILMRFYKEFNIAAECINRAITLLEPEGNNYETMSFARILKFIQLVFQGEYNESQVLFKSIVPQIEGFLDQVPMLRQALKMFSDHFKTN